MDDTGRTWTYSNNRGCTKGTLQPLWREGTNANGGGGYTHAGMGHDVGRGSIHFINFFSGGDYVFGGSQEPWLNARGDYVWIEDAGPRKGTTRHKYQFHLWQNLGSGATKLKRKYPLFLNTGLGLVTNTLPSQPMVTVTAICSAIQTEPWTTYGFILRGT